MTTDLAPTNIFLPALSLEQAIERRNILIEMRHKLLVQDVDYGIIPGTNQKPSLLKPGAEKLCSRFGLVPTFDLVDSVKDWTGHEHGAPLFYFEYRCRLIRDGVIVGEGIGSCNSWEKKYRYRSAERACPNCGAAAIKKSKYPPRNNKNAKPGWYCYGKAGGCSAEFAADDKAITEQETGQVENPDIFDLINTVCKMSQKRALIAAALVATNASEFFTQDVEDYIDVTPSSSYTQPIEQEQQKQTQQQKAKTPLTRAGILTRLNSLAKEAHESGINVPALDVLDDKEALDECDEQTLIGIGKAARDDLDKKKAAREQRENGNRMDGLEQEWGDIDKAQVPA